MHFCKMKSMNEKRHTFCKYQEETIKHFFRECIFIKKCTRHTKVYYEKKNISIEIDSKTLILGMSECAKDKYNIFWLEFKKYIFLCKRKQCIPNINNVKKFIEYSWKIYSKTSNMLCVELLL